MSITRGLARAALLLLLLVEVGLAAEIIPALPALKPNHPRLLLRPEASPLAMSIPALRALPREGAYAELLAQLRGEKSASAQAMVWLLTGESAAAERAIALLRAYQCPGEVDTFHVYFNLVQFALAYDWLYGYEGFTSQIKAEVRSKVLPLAQRGLTFTDDHMFHNYIWMSAGGVALWALATAGEDAQADQLFERIRWRFNTGLFPAWKYLDGLPSEPLGYWALYVFSPGVLTLLATQSAFETNCLEAIRQSEGDWLTRHFENLLHSTLPDLRYVPWGDLQGGPNGGVTRDMAGIIDALTWAAHSAHGAWFSDGLARKCGWKRFRGDTAIYYFLYAGQPRPAAAVPPLSFLAGNHASGHFLARSGWDEGATIVTFRCTDHFGDHHHYDQGSFLIYRNGLLAVDPPVYRTVRGPQQPTQVHNTLLLGGQGQRPARGQWFKTVEDFQRNLTAGRQLETGGVLFWKEAGAWAAVAGEFAQAYSPTQVQSCVRQLLFARPNRILVVDQLAAPPNRSLPEVQWLLQVPRPPVVEPGAFSSTNGKSWLRCRALRPVGAVPAVEPTAVNTHRVSLRYPANEKLTLIHLIEVGDGPQPQDLALAQVRDSPRGLEITLDGSRFRFASQPPFAVEQVTP
jgi:hypothetical protein